VDKTVRTFTVLLFQDWIANHIVHRSDHLLNTGRENGWLCSELPRSSTGTECADEFRTNNNKMKM